MDARPGSSFLQVHRIEMSESRVCRPGHAAAPCRHTRFAVQDTVVYAKHHSRHAANKCKDDLPVATRHRQERSSAQGQVDVIRLGIDQATRCQGALQQGK